MTFDLRLAIGVLFLCCGSILALHGAIVGKLVLGLNINLIWGFVLLAVGSFLAYLAHRGTKN